MTTVIQEPPFVLTWYEHYLNTHEPVLVLGYDAESRLIGLIPLSFSRNDGRLAHAGDWQGEYHGWICEEHLERNFLVEAMIAIKNEFHPRQWTWRWIPPGAHIDWLHSKKLAQNGIFVKYIRQRPPFLDLRAEEKIKKIMRNKSIKSKINRYKKRGYFHLERITSREKAERWFDSLAAQCDFRQEAIHGEAPFENDPNKKKFYIARMRYPQNNHFSILWLNDEPIAYHFGACDDSTVYLGLTAYDPVESRNSPGTVLFVKLIELLRQEGFTRFDLTPGEDEYKARLGSDHHEVVEPTFYFNRRDKLLRDVSDLLRKTVKYLVLALRINPKGIKQKVAKLYDFQKRARNSGWSETFVHVSSRLFKRKKDRYFRLAPGTGHKNHLTDSKGVHTQRYADFMLFRSTSPWRIRADILREALAHYSRGEISYTVVKNGVLTAYGWAGRLSRVKGGSLSANRSGIGENNEVLVLHDFYVNPQVKSSKVFSQVLTKMVNDHLSPAENPIFLILSSKRADLSKVAREMGFEPLNKSEIPEVTAGFMPACVSRSHP